MSDIIYVPSDRWFLYNRSIYEKAESLRRRWTDVVPVGQAASQDLHFANEYAKKNKNLMFKISLCQRKIGRGSHISASTEQNVIKPDWGSLEEFQCVKETLASLSWTDVTSDPSDNAAGRTSWTRVTMETFVNTSEPSYTHRWRLEHYCTSTSLSSEASEMDHHTVETIFTNWGVPQGSTGGHLFLYFYMLPHFIWPIKATVTCN